MGGKTTGRATESCAESRVHGATERSPADRRRNVAADTCNVMQIISSSLVTSYICIIASSPSAGLAAEEIRDRGTWNPTGIALSGHASSMPDF